VTGFPPGFELGDPRSTAIVLAVLATLFLARVVGQLIVATRAPGWLPPMSEWYSGALAYRPLLATQAVVLVALWSVALGLALGLPVLAERRPVVGTALLAIGWVYLVSMVVRYVVRMWRHPEARWLGRTIPIWFHMVLASWILVLGSYLRG